MKSNIGASVKDSESILPLLDLLDRLRAAHDVALGHELNDVSLQLVALIQRVAQQIDDCVGDARG